MKLYDHTLCVVIDDSDEEFLDDDFREFFNRFLIKTKSILPHEKVNRFIRVEDRQFQFVTIHGHSHVRGKRLMSVVKYYLKSKGINFKLGGDVPEPLDEFLTKIGHLPIRLAGGGWTGGKSELSSDDYAIDVGVEPLCTALNEISGVETVASCAGHGFVDGDICTLYAMFMAKELDDLYNLAVILRSISGDFEKSDSVFNGLLHSVHHIFLAGMSDRPMFKIELAYIYRRQDEVFEFIKIYSEKIQEYNERNIPRS